MPITLEPGALFGRYRVVRRLAIGGMAEVWLAQAADGGKPVVLKRILPQFAQDEELLARFEQEAELTLSLVHGNIVPVFEVGRIDDEPYMLMEYLPGRDIRAILKKLDKQRRKAPIGVAAHVGVEVLRGLAYVHGKVGEDGERLRLVHRDVSPSNIVVSDEGVVKLLDFGIAKVFGRASATRTGILVGKVGYMSPEQVRGKPLTAQSDLFSTSVVLYELLAGQRLFDGDSEAEVLEKVRSAPIVPLHLRNPDVPKTLEAIIARGLERNPADRWQHADEYVAELTAFLAAAGWPGDAGSTASFVRELFEDEPLDDSDDELGDVFHTSTATQLPAGSPRPGPALVLGGGGPEGADSGAPTRKSRNLQPVLYGALILAVLVTAGALTGVIPSLAPAPTPTALVADTPAEATLVVSSIPSGAAISVDSRETGNQTPAVLDGLDAGDHELHLELVDHLPTTFSVSLEGGTVKHHEVTLQPDERTVEVVTTPAGAVVSIEGHDPCTAPCMFHGLLPSETVELSAEAPGYQSARLHVRVADVDGPVRIPMNRKPKGPNDFMGPALLGAGKLSLRVKPWGYVSIDGGARTDKPLVDHMLTAGPHKVEMSNPELDKHLTCTFDIRPGKEIRATVDLGSSTPSCPADG